MLSKIIIWFYGIKRWLALIRQRKAEADMVEGHAKDSQRYIDEKVHQREQKEFFNQTWLPKNRNHIDFKEK